MADIQVNTTEPDRKFMHKEHTINTQLLWMGHWYIACTWPIAFKCNWDISLSSVIHSTPKRSRCAHIAWLESIGSTLQLSIGKPCKKLRSKSKRWRNNNLQSCSQWSGKKKGNYQKVMHLTGERDDALPCRSHLMKEHEGRKRQHSMRRNRAATYRISTLVCGLYWEFLAQGPRW